MSTVAASRRANAPPERSSDWRERAGRLYPQLRRPARAMIRRAFRGAFGDDEIEDIYSNAWLGTLRALERRHDQLSDAEVRKYVLTAVANHASKELRRRSRRPTAPLEAIPAIADDRTPPDERAAKREDSRIARDLLATLPPRRRAVMLLRYGWGLEPRQVCGLVKGLSPRAYRKEITRGVDELTEKLRLLERGEWCADREPVLKAYAAGLADAEQQRQARQHLSHCRQCAEFVGKLSGHLHDIGSSVAVLGGVDAIDDGRFSLSDRVGEVVHRVGESAGNALGGRAGGGGGGGDELVARVASLPGGARGAGAAGTGVLAKLAGLGTAGKLAAVCLGGGAAATACLVTGIVPADLRGGKARMTPNRPAVERSVSATPSRRGGDRAPRSWAIRPRSLRPPGRYPPTRAPRCRPRLLSPSRRHRSRLRRPRPSRSSAWLQPRRTRALQAARLPAAAAARRRSSGSSDLETPQGSRARSPRQPSVEAPDQPCGRQHARRGGRRSGAFDGGRRRPHLHRSSVSSAEPRPRRRDAQGRPRLYDSRLLRRPSAGSRGQDRQHEECAAPPVGTGAVVDRIDAPSPGLRGRPGEAAARQRACRAPMDGGSAPERRRAGRQRRSRPGSLPALRLACPGTRGDPVHREPRLPDQKPVPAVRLREDVGAKRAVQGRGLLGSTFTALERNVAWAEVGFAGTRHVHAQAGDSGSGIERLVVIGGRRAADAPGRELRHDRWRAPMRRVLQVCGKQSWCSTDGSTHSLTRPFTTVRTMSRSAQSISPATVRATGKPFASTTRRRDELQERPEPA